MKTVTPHARYVRTLSRNSPGYFFTMTVLTVVAMALLPCSMQAQEPDAEVLVAEGILAYDAKRYDEAISLFSQAIAPDPRQARGFYYLALCHLARGQAEQAIAPLTTLHALRPSDRDVTYQLGTAHFAVRQYDKAAPLLEEVFHQEPDRENLGFYVGFLRYQQKDYDSAAAALSVNASSDPDLRQLALFYRGLALGVLGLADQAIAELASAQRVQPSSPITGASCAFKRLSRLRGESGSHNVFACNSESGAIMTTMSPSIHAAAAIRLQSRSVRARLSLRDW